MPVQARCVRSTMCQSHGSWRGLSKSSKRTCSRDSQTGSAIPVPDVPRSGLQALHLRGHHQLGRPQARHPRCGRAAFLVQVARFTSTNVPGVPVRPGIHAEGSGVGAGDEEVRDGPFLRDAGVDLQIEQLLRITHGSIASGMPSKRRQMAAIVRALPSASVKSGRTVRARSANNSTAG